jgi:hypothetical protein
MAPDTPAIKSGDLVWVSTNDESISAVKESGVVLAVGCGYEDLSSGEWKMDGITVKLQISNTKGVFPPSAVNIFEDKSPIRSRSRRGASRVTLLPSMEVEKPPTKTRKIQPNSKVAEESLAKLEEGDPTEEDKTTSKHFAAKATVPSKNETSIAGEFRVQKSPSSSAKCSSCKEAVRKGEIRLQPVAKSRGWYHAACAKKDFDSIQSADEMEGFEDLVLSDQRRVHQLLGDGDQAMPDNENDNDNDNDNENSSELEDEPIANLMTQKGKAKSSAAKGKKGAAKKKPAQPARRKNDDDNNNMIVADDTDSDDSKDMPFRMEYAKTGRATCKGCDERIQKAELRIAERPLFRGKPGFVVYRHLNCAMFSEEILRLQDVGGWRRIRTEDRERVTDRIEESKKLLEKENQEIQPDELIQTAFQGEIRKPPLGLAGNLLPFQVEGISWMIHQELHIPDIRGGVLADEMGMVSVG